MKREFVVTIWPVSVWIMNAIAAGPGFPLAPPSEKIIRCLSMFVSSVSCFFSVAFVVVVVQSHQFMNMNG